LREATEAKYLHKEGETLAGTDFLLKVTEPDEPYSSTFELNEDFAKLEAHNSSSNNEENTIGLFYPHGFQVLYHKQEPEVISSVTADDAQLRLRFEKAGKRADILLRSAGEVEVDGTLLSKDGYVPTFSSAYTTKGYVDGQIKDTAAAVRRYVLDLVEEMENLHFEKVETLPEVGQGNVIYLVYDEEYDAYDEYIWVIDEGGYELIGRANIDLSWGNISGKPFSSVGANLTVTGDKLTTASNVPLLDAGAQIFSGTNVFQNGITTGIIRPMGSSSGAVPIYISNTHGAVPLRNVYMATDNADLTNKEYVDKIVKDTSTAIRGEFSKYAQLDGKNEFTQANVFRIRDSFLIRAQSEIGDDRIRFKFNPSLLNGSLQSTFISSRIEQLPMQLNLMFGRSVFEEGGGEASLKFSDYNAAKVTLRADGGITLDGNTTISDGDKLQYGTTAATYPTPAANNEYITKGWTDATYPKYSNQGSKSFSFSDAGTNYTGALLVSDFAVVLGQEGVTNDRSARTYYSGGVIQNQVEEGSLADGDYASNNLRIHPRVIEIDSPLVRTTSQVTADDNEFITKGWADATFKPTGYAPAWGDVTGKPFSTIGAGLTVTDDVLSATPQAWPDVTGKPFTDIGDGLDVDEDGKLNADAPSWIAVTSKPFNSIGSGLTVTGDVLSATPAAAPTWSTTTGKPFSTIGAGLQVSGDALSVIPTTSSWSDVTAKPFTTIGTGLTVENSVLINPAETWTSVIDKPFTSIGSGLAVAKLSDTDYSLYVTNTNYPSWSNVTGKPFEKLSSAFSVTSGTLDIVDGAFVKATTLKDSMATLPSKYASLTGDNLFTGNNVFKLYGEMFSIQDGSFTFDVAGGELSAQVGEGLLYMNASDVKLSYGESSGNPAKITLLGNNGSPKIQMTAPSGIELQENTRVALDKKILWSDDPDKYPTPRGDNEYITKGWADATYGGQTSGTPEWSNVQHKPFSSIGTGLTVTDGTLSATATMPTWSQVTSKPFNSIGTGLAVTGDVLTATASTPTWAATTGKPFSAIGQGLIVTADELSANVTWSGVGSKPFTSIGSGLSVVSGALTAPAPPTPTWETTTGKPFSTVGTGLSVSGDVLSVASTTPAWSDVTSKPFGSIGSGLTVTGDVLSATAATPTWSTTTGKPFSTVGSGLTVTGDALTANTPSWSATTGKPFTSIGSGLTVTDGALTANASGDFMKLSGGNNFSDAQIGTLDEYEAFSLTAPNNSKMYFNLSPGKEFRAGNNATFVNVDSSSVSLFANSGTNYATFYAYPDGEIFTRADKGFTMDGDVVINTGHKLGWNSVSSSSYPTPTTNSEYVTKGWTDLTYAKKGAYSWASVTDKPFIWIGQGLTVVANELRATENWGDIHSKPFVKIGEGLTVVADVGGSILTVTDPAPPGKYILNGQVDALGKSMVGYKNSSEESGFYTDVNFSRIFSRNQADDANLRYNNIDVNPNAIQLSASAYGVMQLNRLEVRSDGTYTTGQIYFSGTNFTTNDDSYIIKRYADSRYQLKSQAADKSTGSLHDWLQNAAIAVLSLLLGRKKIASTIFWLGRVFRWRGN
jgi:hypothetical protein